MVGAGDHRGCFGGVDCLYMFTPYFKFKVGARPKGCETPSSVKVRAYAVEVLADHDSAKWKFMGRSSGE